MTFEIERVVVDGDSQPIENLSRADFVLRACSPTPATGLVNCVRGTGSDVDVAYEPATATPDALVLVAGSAARPCAAAMLLDQSGSILESDPSGARLFSSKAFLSGLGADDQALVAAFAGGPGAILPTRPLTPYGPFRARNAASSYFPTLDGLTALVGGNTPLYGSVGRLLSLSLPTYRLRWTVQAGTAGVFRPGQALFGRVGVSAAGRPVDIALIGGIRASR